MKFLRPRTRLNAGLRLGLLLASFAGALRLAAHDFTISEARLKLGQDHFEMALICDLDAFALGAPPDADSQALAETLASMPREELEPLLNKLRDFLQRRIRLRFDGEAADLRISFPELGKPLSENRIPTFIGTRAHFEGRIPEDASHFTLMASRSLPPVSLVVERHNFPPDAPLLLTRGAQSDPIALQAPARRGWSAVMRQYLGLGFLHIVPRGLDHILFVLGLFLMAARMRPLLLQVTAFTLAHTITLALAVLAIFSLPARLVESLIALSIVYVAVENLFAKELKPHRLLIVFLFGLLHGLGFAGVLAELGLPPGGTVLALIAFNIGVELGQISVLLFAFLLLGRLRDRPEYRKWVVVPGSLLIGAIGLYWVVERAFALA